MADATAQTDAPAAELPHTKEKLDELASAASLQYSLKNYSLAADHYADACEIQSAINGDHAAENAELLFYYGRALYKVAVQRSDVLGGKVAQEEKKNKPKAESAAKAESSSAPANGATSAKKEESAESKPYFQLTGDENWTDSEDEEEAQGGEAEGEEEDEFQNAFEAFEQARVLYEKQLDALSTPESEDKGKGKAELTPQARAIKEKLADCHGFLAEISLEAERPHDAVDDGRKALALEEELHPFEHENVSSAHYSLSLALELASAVARQQDIAGTEEGANGADQKTESQEQEINYELRNEAAKQTDLAIRSVEARLQKEKAAFETAKLTAEEKREKLAIIKDKTGILDEMKERLVDLKTDPKSQVFDSIDPSVMQGLMGSILNADAATKKAKLEEATKSANDISGLVKVKRKEKAPAASTPSDPGNGKRKLEVEDNANGKRAKTEEIP